MTDEQIIKALECCFLPNVADTCPRKRKDILCNDGCERMLVTDALDLINRQQDLNKALINGQETLQKTIVEQQAEIERLTTMNSELNIGIKKLKEFAIKEFAERLKEISDRDGWTDSSEIDNLLKEMTEPVKIEHNSLCETETYMGELMKE